MRVGTENLNVSAVLYSESRLNAPNAPESITRPRPSSSIATLANIPQVNIKTPFKPGIIVHVMPKKNIFTIKHKFLRL